MEPLSSKAAMHCKIGILVRVRARIIVTKKSLGGNIGNGAECGVVYPFYSDQFQNKVD